MIKELIHDPILLARKSEAATKEDLQGAQDLLDAPLSQAILEQAKSDRPDGLYHTESHVILSTEGGVEADRTDDPDAPSALTVYAMVMQKSFSFSTL